MGINQSYQDDLAREMRDLKRVTKRKYDAELKAILKARRDKLEQEVLELEAVAIIVVTDEHPKRT